VTQDYHNYTVKEEAVWGKVHRPSIFIQTFVLNNLWRRGIVVSGIRRMNEVNPRRARLVHGWVTVFRHVYHLGM